MVSVLAIIFLFIPIETTLVPEWKVQVVNENGLPYQGILVRQFCDDYSLGISPCSRASDSTQYSDENGFVMFPKRAVSANLFYRIAGTAFSYLMIFAHGSTGQSVYLDATESDGYKTLSYTGGHPPDKFILPSKMKNDVTQPAKFPNPFR